MKSIIRRLSIVEKNICTCVIPEKERIIVIPYPANHDRNVNRKLTICDNLILTTPEQS